MIDRKILKKYACDYGIALNDENLDDFNTYAEFLLAWNLKTNLTAITKLDDILIKHFLDSLLVLPHINKQNAAVIDIGSGAGFPGIPLKIVKPDIKLTLLDSHNKRIAFLKAISEKLGQENCYISQRAEEASRGKIYRESFDYVIARAVAPLNILCELCFPYVVLGGAFIACKGPEVDAEVENAENAISKLGGEISHNISINMPNKNTRSILVIKKISQTPTKYPRNFGRISKSPL